MKIIAAIGSVLISVVGLWLFSSILYAPNIGDKPGYLLPSSATAAVQAAPVAEVPLPVLLAKADASRGEGYTKVCQSCHNFAKDGTIKIGPPLYGVVGRNKGSYAGFAYSDGMKNKGGAWTYADLFTFIKKPSAYVSGTKMTYPGEADDEKRADILAYLQKNADTPVPFPK